MSKSKNPVNADNIYMYLAGLVAAIINCLIVFKVAAFTPEQIVAIEGVLAAVFGFAVKIRQVRRRKKNLSPE